MNRSNRQSKPRTGFGVAAAVGFLVLTSCGSTSTDDATATDPAVSAATTTEALDLTDVRFDVRRDPG